MPWWAKTWKRGLKDPQIRNAAVKIEKWVGKESERSLTTFVLSVDADGFPCVEIWEGELKEGKDEVRIGPHVFEDSIEEVLQIFGELLDLSGWVDEEGTSAN